MTVNLQHVPQERLELSVLARQASSLLSDLFQKASKHHQHLQSRTHGMIETEVLHQVKENAHSGVCTYTVCIL